MSILADLKNLETSCIYKLEVRETGKVLGLRVKYYSIEDKGYQYYDFVTSLVKDISIKGYLKLHSRQFQSLYLIQNGEDYCTRDELDGIITVQEFKDTESAEKILDRVIEIMEARTYV